MMGNRYGEKIGWVAGWLGGFIWVAIMSIVFLYQNKFVPGVLGIFLTAVAIAVILYFAPWRHPSTPYGKLMLVPYGIFALSIAWAIWSYGGLESVSVGFSWWNLLWLIPALIPFGIFSNKKWGQEGKGCRKPL